MYVLASFIAAFAIGYTVQNSDDKAVFAQDAATETPSMVDPLTVENVSAPSDHSLLLPSAPAATMSVRPVVKPAMSPAVRMRETLQSNPVQSGAFFSAYGVQCSTTLTTDAAPAAMISVKLSASCAPNQAFLLKQGELKVTGMTSAVGLAEIELPAMSETSEISVIFDDGQRVSSSVFIEDFGDFDRVALQWKGRTGLAIHALEFGADYGQAGHVSRTTPRTPEHAVGALGGFMTRVGFVDGAESMHAEIYTFPSSNSRRDGAIRLSVEAEITQFNCETEVFAQTLHPKSATGIEVVDLNLLMPECDAIGDFLVLNNLLRDLKIALN